jgi:hypothetical protein
MKKGDHPDICANRHRGDRESRKANLRVNKSADRVKVLVLIRASGKRGMTLDEASSTMRKAPNQISGRFTELKRRKQIEPNEETRLTRTGSPAKVYVSIN